MADLLEKVLKPVSAKLDPLNAIGELNPEGALAGLTQVTPQAIAALRNSNISSDNIAEWELVKSADLLSFLHDRFKVYLKDEGARYDAIDAVLSPDADNLLLVARRVEALIVFINEEDGKNLLAGTKRAANILAAEEKKGTKVASSVDAALLKLDEEKALYAAVNLAAQEAQEAIAGEDFGGAMLALAKLRGPVDTFFEKVLVNDEDENVRANRLALLEQIRTATSKVADFSKIAG